MNVIIYWTNKNQEKSRKNILSPTVSVHICIKKFLNASFDEGGDTFMCIEWKSFSEFHVAIQQAWFHRTFIISITS